MKPHFKMPKFLLFIACCVIIGLASGVKYSNTLRQKKYDYVVIGAGSAGATAASRLSDDDGSTVLLLEAGGQPNPVTDLPIFAGKLPELAPELMWSGSAEPQENACQANPGGLCSWTHGKCLGGTSVRNIMCWTRGNKNDYENWERMGAKGWNYQTTLEVFRRTENVTDNRIARNGFRGINGRQTVSSLPYKTKLGKAFLEAGKQYGYEILEDYNGASQQGFGFMQASMRNGLRCSTEKSFLRPVADRTNLDILTGAYVLNVSVDENQTVRGVWFDHLNETKFIGVQKEVLLSAGAISSPMILMHSGIGPREHLEQLKIPVVVDLPGVGQNLQDHPFFPVFNYQINESAGIVYDHAINPETIGQLLEGEGPLTSPGFVEVVGFVSSMYRNKSEEWPDLMLFGSNSPFFGVGGLDYPNVNALGLNLVLLRPKSRGFVKLKSSNPYDDPVADPKYFTVEDDIKTSINGARIIMSLMETPALKRFNPQPLPSVLPECKEFPLNSDQYIQCGLRKYILGGLHYSGTCKMGKAQDPNTVVEPTLKVKGIKGIRVADASVMPQITSGAPNAVCIMIGHRAAEMMLSEN